MCLRDARMMGPKSSAATESESGAEHSSTHEEICDHSTTDSVNAGLGEHEGGVGTLTRLFSPSRNHFIQQIRGLFLVNESAPLHCLQFYEWILESARVEVIPPPPGLSLEPDQYIYNAALQNGCLLFCIRVPEDYPGGRRAFNAATESFLKTRKSFGITAVYLDEASIEDFLAKLKDNFKAQSKAKAKGKGKAAKGKHIKWKNPSVKFGCRVVWAHDLIQPEKLYLRVKSLEKNAAALIVVDTNDEAYKFDFNSDKVLHFLYTSSRCDPR